MYSISFQKFLRQTYTLLHIAINYCSNQLNINQQKNLTTISVFQAASVCVGKQNLQNQNLVNLKKLLN